MPSKMLSVAKLFMTAQPRPTPEDLHREQGTPEHRLGEMLQPELRSYECEEGGKTFSYSSHLEPSRVHMVEEPW